jgi:hypothetical protein
MNYHDYVKQFEGTLWDYYRVKLKVGHLVGGVPKDPKMVEAWIGATCKEFSQEERAKIVQATVAALPEKIGEELDNSGTTFLVDPDNGLYLEGRQLKALLKECANIMRNSVPSGKKDGELGVAALKSKMADQVFVEEEKVFLDRQRIDRTIQRAIHIPDGPRGPRNAIKVSDILDNVDVAFTVRRLRKGTVSEEALFLCLHFGEQNGLGADRSQGFGKFKVVSVDKLTFEEFRALMEKPFEPSWLKEKVA